MWEFRWNSRNLLRLFSPCAIIIGTCVPLCGTASPGGQAGGGKEFFMEEKKTVQEVLDDYTAGRAGLDETNRDLEEIGSTLRLDPGRNLFTPEELLETRAGETPDEANGWGIMDHGVGCMEKVRVVDGRTVDVDMGEETAYVYIGGRKYRLRGDVLTEED